MNILIDGIYYSASKEPVIATDIYGHIQTISPKDYSIYNFRNFQNLNINGVTITREKANLISNIQCRDCENYVIQAYGRKCNQINNYPFDLLDAVNGECQHYKPEFREENCDHEPYPCTGVGYAICKKCGTIMD